MALSDGVVDEHETFGEKLFFVGEGFVEGTLGDVHSSSNVVHGDASNAAVAEQFDSGFYNFFSIFV